MILGRYLIREIARPFLLVLFVLSVIFMAYSASDLLSDVAAGYLEVDAVAKSIVLKTVIALEVILPVSLYLTVVFSLVKLSSRGEIAAMAACGYGGGRLMRPLLGLFLVVGLASGAISVYLRPAAYAYSYELQTEAAAEVDLEDLLGERFHGTKDGDRVFFVGDFDAEARTFRRVFVWSWDESSPLIVLAREASYEVDAESGKSRLDLSGLRALRKDGREEAMSSDRLQCEIANPRVSPRYKRKAESTADLMASDRPKDLAELQWRLARPVSTLLLGLLAFGLGRVPPGHDRYRPIVIAVFIYLAYHQFGVAAKTWVENGVVGRFPGIWWLEVLLAVFVAVLLRRRGRP